MILFTFHWFCRTPCQQKQIEAQYNMMCMISSLYRGSAITSCRPTPLDAFCLSDDPRAPRHPHLAWGSHPIPSFALGIVFECLGDSLVDHFKVLLQAVSHRFRDHGLPHTLLFRRFSQIHYQGSFLILIGLIHAE
jgi:hypothetical protein